MAITKKSATPVDAHAISRLSWEQVDKVRERMQGAKEAHPLDSAWQMLDTLYRGAIDRRERSAQSPVDALFLYVETGFYPPPELLLALHDAYAKYRALRGRASLEDVLFGPPVPRAGNHAPRRAARMEREIWGIELWSLMRKGLTKEKAAEKLAEQLGGKHDPETIARRAIMGKADRKRSG
jgi:hypothetical protein